MRKQRIRCPISVVGGKPRTEIPGRLPDDEYAAMAASLKAEQKRDGKSKAWMNGDYTRWRKHREQYVEEERGRES